MRLTSNGRASVEKNIENQGNIRLASSFVVFFILFYSGLRKYANAVTNPRDTSLEAISQAAIDVSQPPTAPKPPSLSLCFFPFLFVCPFQLAIKVLA